MKYKVYHGSGQEFDEFRTDKARVINDHFGGLLYFTDKIDIARQYADAMSKKSKDKLKVIYTVTLDINNLFDVKKNYTGKEVKKILGSRNVENFARNARLLKLGADKFQIISDLKSGSMPLTGEQIFLGLSENQQKTVVAREVLKKAGYDGLKYSGGKLLGSIPHNVYLPYNTSAVNIVDVKKIS